MAEGSDPDEIVGVENPKIVEWEDLQQELGRLLSLSSELKQAKDRKESLAQRLESIIEVRRKSLRQSNELEEMRQRLDARRFAVGDLAMRNKEELEDVSSRREQLCLAIRTLLAAGKTLAEARQQLEESKKLLGGTKGHNNLNDIQKMLRKRQQHMIAQVNTLYPVKALNEQISKDKLDSLAIGNKSGDTEGSPLPNASKLPLTILGLQLTSPPLKKMSLFTDKDEVRRSATALGYVAHAVLLIATYLDVPLRYPLRLGGSHSYVHDYAPSVDTMLSDLGSSPIMGTNANPTEFPLFIEGQDATRAAYAIFLLNKDIEQLLNYIGVDSLGPRHVLANLKELMRIIRSPDYINQ